jgi:amino-acid N-acetyltransferase
MSTPTESCPDAENKQSTDSNAANGAGALVEWFRASTQYINAHRGKTFVVALSGEALASEHLRNLVSDLTLLHSLGVKLVLVHGARPQINAALTAAKLPLEFHKGMRVTDPDSLAVIAGVVGGESIRLEALFSAGTSSSTSAPLAVAGSEALTLSRGNFVTAMPIGVHNGIDFHHTGRVRRVKAASITKRLEERAIVLQNNLGYSLTGEIFNLTAEEVATELAIAIKADKLIFLVPQEGVCDEQGELIASLNPASAGVAAERFSASDIDSDKALGSALKACIKANAAGVNRAHLIGYRSNGALIRELFTREGAGSLISDDSLDTLRQAKIDDVSAILSLIRPLEADGTLVERSRERLETEIENFKVIELEGAIIACAALYRTSESLAEIACIATHPNYRRSGLGARLLQSLSAEAKGLGIEKVFVLTTVTAHWFIDHGFAQGTLDDLPEQRQALYNLQRKSKIFLKSV